MAEAPVRRDAARNRERLLAAARAVVAEQGAEAPLDEIARAAGVSRTTLHRHFADRAALAAAVLQENVEEIEARALELAVLDDGALRLFDLVLDIQLHTPWLARMAMREQGHELGTLSDRTRAAFAPLMARAQEAGLAHPGTTAADVLLALPMMTAAIAVQGHSGGADELRRARQLLHRGLFTVSAPGDAPGPRTR